MFPIRLRRWEVRKNKKKKSKSVSISHYPLTLVFRYGPHVQVKIVGAAQDVLVLVAGEAARLHGARIVILRVVELTEGVAVLRSVKDRR